MCQKVLQPGDSCPQFPGARGLSVMRNPLEVVIQFLPSRPVNYERRLRHVEVGALQPTQCSSKPLFSSRIGGSKPVKKILKLREYLAEMVVYGSGPTVRIGAALRPRFLVSENVIHLIYLGFQSRSPFRIDNLLHELPHAVSRLREPVRIRVVLEHLKPAKVHSPQFLFSAAQGAMELLLLPSQSDLTLWIRLNIGFVIVFGTRPWRGHLGPTVGRGFHLATKARPLHGRARSLLWWSRLLQVSAFRPGQEPGSCRVRGGP